MTTIVFAACLAPLAPLQISHAPRAVSVGGPNDLYGMAVQPAMDMDADLRADFIVTALDSNSANARVVSGADGSELWIAGGLEFEGFFPDDVLGVGDFTGDGFGDLLIGYPQQGIAQIRDSQTNALVRQFDGLFPDDLFGAALGIAGDVDLDGVPDLIIGAPGTTGNYARVLSGSDGSVLLHLSTSEISDKFGSAVDGVGDVNGDGIPDVVVGATSEGNDYLHPGFPPFIPPFWTDDNSGGVFVHSGSTGSLLFSQVGTSPEEGFGYSVAGLGDVDGDLIPDLAAGTAALTDRPSPGYARILSGFDGSILFSLLENEGFATHFVRVEGPGDLNNDGRADLLLSAMRDAPEGPLVRAVSGANGATLLEYLPAIVYGEITNVSVAAIGDAGVDGVGDFVVGVSGMAYGLGYVVLFDSAESFSEPFCFGDGSRGFCPCGGFGQAGDGCANSSGAGAQLETHGLASVSNDTFSLSVSGVPGSKPGLILRGAQTVAGGFGNPAGNGLLCTTGQTARSQVLMTTSQGLVDIMDFQGNSFGASSYGVGVDVYYQFWYRDSQNACGGEFNFTNAWRVRWQP